MHNGSMDATPPETATAPPPFNPARIANYYDQVHKASWGRRAAGLFAGATLGFGFGGAIGAIAAFLPWLLMGAALPALGAIALSAAIYAGIGAFSGVVVGTAVGESAGAVAGGLAIREHQESLANAQQPIIATQPTRDAGPSGPKYFSWRPAAFFGTICSAFGAITTATGSPIVISAAATLFGGVTGAALVPAAAIMFGLFGSLFGFKFGRFSNGLSNFHMKALSDDLWTNKKTTPEVISPAPTPAPVKQPVAEPCIGHTRSHTTFTPHPPRKTLACARGSFLSP